MAAALIGALAGGAILGGIGSYLSAQSSKEALQTQLDYLKSLSPELQSQYQTQIDTIESALAERESALGGDETTSKYLELVQGYDPTAYEYTPTDFTYTSGVEAFYDPAVEYRKKAAQEARQSSLAAQGNLFGGGAQRQLEAEAQEIASEEWAAAYDRMAADKESAYQKYRDKISDVQKDLETQQAGYLTQTNLYGNLASDIYGAQDTAAAQQLAALQQYQQNTLDLGQSIAGVQAQKSSINPLASTLQGISGGATTGANIYGALSK